jgi:ankyrin repeat protein
MIYQVRKDMRARGNVTEVLLLSQTLTELLRSTLRLSPSAIVQPWELDPSSIQYVTEQIDELRQNNSIGLAASMQETLLLSSTMSSNPIELRQNVDLLVQLNSDHHVELPGIRAVETVPLLLRPAILENSMIVAAIIKNGNEIPSTTDALGRTALHMALDHSSVHPAQWELLHDDLEPECRTPTEKENVVDALLKWKVPIGARDIFRRTALHIACYNQVGIDIVKLLLASKQPSFQLDSKDSTGRTPFAWAVRTSQYAVAKLLLATGRVNVNSMDEIYQTPLKFAARIGNEGLVKLLLGAPGIQADCGKDDSTPLQWAFSTGHEEVLKLLIQRNDVNVNVEVEGHQTFLVWAVRRGRQELVKLLLERDDIQTETVFMTRTARQWAVFDGFEGVVRQFEDYDLRQAVVHAGRG